GQWVDLAIEDAAMAGVYPWSLPIYTSNNSGLAQARRLSPESLPLLECKDGYVRFNLFLHNHWQAFVRMIGSPEVLLQPEWDRYEFRTNHHDLLRVLALEFTGERTKEELFVEAQRRGIGLTAVKTPEELVRDPQIVARGFFVDLPHPELGRLRVPGRPFRLSEAALPPLRPPEALAAAPEEWLGGSPGGGGRALGTDARRPSPAPGLPLRGIRVVEFSAGAAVPELGMALADFGAEVIKVESRAHL